MIEIQHTPGPWRVELRHDGIPFGISSPSVMQHDCDTLCIMPTGGDWRDRHPEMVANANLIATAPELKRKLEDVRCQLNMMANENISGGWSTHQVDTQRKLATEIRQLLDDSQ